MSSVIIKDFNHLVFYRIDKESSWRLFISITWTTWPTTMPGTAMVGGRGPSGMRGLHLEPPKPWHPPSWHELFQFCGNFKVANILFSIASSLLLLQLLQELQGGGWQEEMQDQDVGGHPLTCISNWILHQDCWCPNASWIHHSWPTSHLYIWILEMTFSRPSSKRPSPWRWPS